MSKWEYKRMRRMYFKLLKAGLIDLETYHEKLKELKLKFNHANTSHTQNNR